MTKPTKGLVAHTPELAMALQNELGPDWKVYHFLGNCGCDQLDLILVPPLPVTANPLDVSRWLATALRARLAPGGKLFYV